MASFLPRGEDARDEGEDGGRIAPETRRTYGPVGADRAPVRPARAMGLRAHPPPSVVRQPRRRARAGHRGVLRSYARTEGRPLRGGGHGKPFRFGSSPRAPEAAARHAAPRRGPEGRVPRLQPERDLARVLRALRESPGPQDGLGGHKGLRDRIRSMSRRFGPLHAARPGRPEASSQHADPKRYEHEAGYRRSHGSQDMDLLEDAGRQPGSESEDERAHESRDVRPVGADTEQDPAGKGG